MAVATRVAASRRLLRSLFSQRTQTRELHVEDEAKPRAGAGFQRNPSPECFDPQVNMNSRNRSKSRQEEPRILQNQMDGSDESCHESALVPLERKQDDDRRKQFLAERLHPHLDVCARNSDRCARSAVQGNDAREKLVDEEDTKPIAQASTYSGLSSLQNTTVLLGKLDSKVDSSTEDLQIDKYDHVDPIQTTKLHPAKELHIILDLNGVLIKRWDKNPLLPGIHKKTKKWIQLRPGCIDFLQRAFSVFHVGIWSTMRSSNVQSICSLIEQQANQTLPFFMIWGQNLCYQHGSLRRPDKAHVLADFKPMTLIWKHFPHLGPHNTILVDDSPYKACMNNPQNCIFPDAFDGCTKDTFLSEMLWPYLERMRLSNDIQSFISNNRLGQQPITDGHELYDHFSHVMEGKWS